jgi:uncharacterized protein (DUF2141 family)
MRNRRTAKGGALLAVALALCATAPAGAQPATTLEIHVRNVSPKGGIMRLGLYDAAGYPDDKGPVAAADVPATRGETVITLRNLVPGTYAIEAYQDVNSNDRMDKSWIGLPLEPYGFSRDARPVLSKPGFDRVKFTVAPGANVQVLRLQNSDAPGE